MCIRDRSVARGRVEQPLWPESELRPWGVAKAQLDPALTDPEQIVRQTPWVDGAAAITRPTLLVTGGRDDQGLVGPHSRQRLGEVGGEGPQTVGIDGERAVQEVGALAVEDDAVVDELVAVNPAHTAKHDVL